MKIKRINLIETPRKEFKLEDKEMSYLLGGEVCNSFLHCSTILTDYCNGGYSENGSCNGSEGMKCERHSSCPIHW